MLASIVPLGERGRNRRWGVTAGAYVMGSLAAGASFGAVLALFGGAVAGLGVLSREWVLTLAAGACLAGAAADLGLGGLRVPTVRRQVNEDWLLRYRGWVSGVGFGFQLGLGVVTIVTTATIYVLFGLAFLSASWAIGCGLGATFGLVRSLPVLAMVRATTPGRLRQAHRRMQGWARAAQRAAVGAQCVAAAGGIALLVRS